MSRNLAEQSGLMDRGLEVGRYVEAHEANELAWSNDIIVGAPDDGFDVNARSVRAGDGSLKDTHRDEVHHDNGLECDLKSGFGRAHNIESLEVKEIDEAYRNHSLKVKEVGRAIETSLEVEEVGRAIETSLKAEEVSVDKTLKTKYSYQTNEDVNANDRIQV